MTDAQYLNLLAFINSGFGQFLIVLVSIGLSIVLWAFISYILLLAKNAASGLIGPPPRRFNRGSRRNYRNYRKSR